MTVLLLSGGAVLSSCSSSLQDGNPKDVLGEDLYNKVSEKYEYIHDFSGGIAQVTTNLFADSCSFINTKGEVVLPWFVYGKEFNGYKLKEVDDFSNGLARVKVEDDAEIKKYGYINTKGELAIDCKFYDAEDFENGFAVVATEKEDGKWGTPQNYGYINEQGELKIAGPYTRAYSFTEDGLAAVRNDKDQYGFINTNGELVIPFKYDDVSNFSEGYSIVATENDDEVTIELINTKGEKQCTLSNKYDYPTGEVHDGMLLFSEEESGNEDETYGYMNTKGEIVIPNRYVAASDFEDGIAIVKKNGRLSSQYINTKGEEVEK